ncbi:predicted protein [Chaetoceros tenuissimus]|uniref:Uncharacterized protein n=1 Tax=Chaetoceros tenuissimus TaxID=426638 RepID=A0AAD3HCS1_9STRA|nr:predicted protein [Chaetoceros tenuissimus]
MQEVSLAPWQEIDSLKEQFRTATIKNDVNKSLDYVSKLVTRVQELGGVIHDSDIVSKKYAMTDMITTLDDPKMAEFIQFRNALRREDQKLTEKGKQGRSSNTLIGELNGEYIRIFGESKAELNEKSNEWTEAQSNKKDDIETKLSEYPKDKLVKVLALLVREGSKENTNDSKRPAWKEEKPKDGEKIRTVDGVEYHWCPHCNKGNGMWTTHAKHLTPEEFKAQQKEKDRSKEEESLLKPDISVDRTSLNSLRRGNLSFLDSDSDSDSDDIAFWQDLWSNNLPDIVEVDIEEDNSNADYLPLCKTKTEPNTDEIFEREMEEYNSSGASEGENLNPIQASTNSVEHRIIEKATNTTPTVEEQVKELLATVEILTSKRNEYHLRASPRNNVRFLVTNPKMKSSCETPMQILNTFIITCIEYLHWSFARRLHFWICHKKVDLPVRCYADWLLNKSIKSNRVYALDNGRIQYLRSRERPPIWEQLVEQNTEHYGVVDPRTEPTSLDWSNLHLEELKNRDGVSFGKPEGADHTSHKADDTEQSNPGAPQINDDEEEESRPSESESVFHPSERTEGDDNKNKTRLESLDLDQPRLRRTQQIRKLLNRKFLFTTLKNHYRVVYAIKNRLKSFRFPDLPISSEETHGIAGLRGSVKIRTMIKDHKIYFSL